MIIGTAAVYAPRSGCGQRRRDIDDASAGLLRQHLLDRELGDVEEAFDVRRDERPEIVDCVIREGLREKDPGVVDQRVDRPEAHSAVSTILAAVAGSPMSPSTSAS